MLQTALHSCSLVAVVMHALLGCCLHHDHACQAAHSTLDGRSVDQRVSQFPTEVVSSACHGHSHCHAADSGSPDEFTEKSKPNSNGQPASDCDEPNCQLIASNSSVSLVRSNALMLWCCDALPVPASDAYARLARRYGSSFPPDDLMATLPLRAQSQVWRL